MQTEDVYPVGEIKILYDVIMTGSFANKVFFNDILSIFPSWLRVNCGAHSDGEGTTKILLALLILLMFVLGREAA